MLDVGGIVMHLPITIVINFLTIFPLAGIGDVMTIFFLLFLLLQLSCFREEAGESLIFLSDKGCLLTRRYQVHGMNCRF